jgi:lysophospholipase L1-like esterase
MGTGVRTMTASPPPCVYLFAGDSLTEGTYGESYVERVARALAGSRTAPAIELVNAGRGGDTVQALLNRIDEPLRHYRPQWVILTVGTNDVWLPWLTAHSLGWRLWLFFRRLASGQTPTTDLDQFAAAYRALIDRARIIARARVLSCTVSPVGEQLSSPVNQRLARLNGVIKDVSATCQVPVADVWQAFVDEIASLPRPSTYVPGEWLFTRLDQRRLRTGGTSPDELSRRRRLLLTFDGLHLNSRGADLWANAVVAALAQAQGAASATSPGLARRLGLPFFEQGPLQACCTPGWEARAREVGRLLAAAYSYLASLTGAHPAVCVAVLNRLHWEQGAGSLPYPTPAAWWDGVSGTIFVPEAYPDRFLRDLRLPETLAAGIPWPSALAQVGEPARATALVDLLAVQELAGLFLRELRVAPADPELTYLLANYLTLVLLRAGAGEGVAEMAAAWDAWGEVLARSGLAEGRIRQQAEALYEVHGDDLVASLANRPSSVVERVKSFPLPSA